MPVAFGRAGLGAHVGIGADPLGGIGFNQLLHYHPDRLTDQIHAITGTNASSSPERADWDKAIGRVSFSVSLRRFTPKIPPMAAYVTQPRRRPSNPPPQRTLLRGSRPPTSHEHPNEEHPDPRFRGSGCPRCPETSHL
ncbi:hypothetical protein GCM10022263_03050 [Nocardioides daeguensis]|uniref:Uncharacterized protein n=1 Tax=Nocardioides daeguensis TaxID=908359 RepID=A0ABP6UQW2_9ACTN